MDLKVMIMICSKGYFSWTYGIFQFRFYNDICRMVKEHKEGMDFQTELEETENVEVCKVQSRPQNT